jgi:hypothetical protein
MLVFVSVPFGIMAINRGFLDANDGLWLRSVGFWGCIAQLALQLIMMVVIVLVGIRIGQRSALPTTAATNHADHTNAG